MLKNISAPAILCFGFAFGFAFAGFGSSPAQAQVQPPKFEIGGHFTFLNMTPPTFSFFADKKTSDSGLGATLTYNLTRVFSLEAEVNYFPRIQDNNPNLGPSNGGRKVQSLFGVKAGHRTDKFGVFAKARPGLMHFSGVFDCLGKRNPDTQCGPHPKTEFALDIGGVAEYYLTRRVMLRFDAGDTIIRFSERHMFQIDLSPLPATIPGKTTHNLQINAGIGYRF